MDSGIKITSPTVLALKKTAVVVIDDDESICEACRQTLEENGIRTEVSTDGTEGLRLVEKARPNVVLVDLKMPKISGIDVLKKIPEINPGIVPIVITGYGTIDTAVESMKIGAFDFITKPFEPEKLIETVTRGIKLSQIRQEATARQASLAKEEAAKEEKLDKEDVLLRGLSLLGDSYSLGLDRGDFIEELKRLDAEAKHHADNLGQAKQRERAILDIVNELRSVDEIIKKYDYTKNAIIQILLETQLKLRWLPKHVLKWISVRLNIPLGKIYAIANFYEAFSLEPQGEHTVHVCTGTACHVKGAPNLLREISAILDIKEGETDKEQLFTLKTVHCLGCCALSPVVQIDDSYVSDPSATTLKEIFGSLGQKEEHI
ncbi:Benzoyl-CoA reductase electron transfer protein, putative (modular protein) [uncultured Desulfobacterium sp.]|uniref:Benzoyl-CoA reductase electron transfer protein, putative (Modular protein) n=1 Tax=uncultured Desulfobacterium sp. TaxID=201089 RepID=A0A445MU38_9BACT|nr:Benzoyl-CoA reductase electron transfer protein, putative (modular protein) [uncultured Desulfobacterium sp.]